MATSMSPIIVPATLVLCIALVSTLPSLSATLPFFELFLTSRSEKPPTPSLQPLTTAPHFPSWISWWHPQSKVNWGKSTHADEWNLMYHLGGTGPWIEKIDGVLDVGQNGIGPPPGCVVDGVHMMSRHGERYPTASAGERHMAILARIKSAGIPMNGSLAFLNNWTYITQTPEDHFGQLIAHGPYAGTLQAFTTGVRLRPRYSHLALRKPTLFWASDCKRVVDSARYFAAGFFGWNWESERLATLEIIPETHDCGPDTLTPGDTCTRYLDDPEEGHDKGINMLTKFQNAYIPQIVDRLSGSNPNICFTNKEIFSMQEMCGFETMVRGSSAWCEVFTIEDWDNFEYARDLLHYYRAGPGNIYAPSMGWLWLNKTTELLSHPSSVGDMYFSFVHDGDIAPMLAALQIYEDPLALPATHIVKDRRWKTSQVMPMGGRILFERLACNNSATSGKSDPVIGNHDITKSRFIRININDGIVPLADCDSGPGSSCPLDQFTERTRRRGEKTGVFEMVCGLTNRAGGSITFLKQQ